MRYRVKSLRPALLTLLTAMLCSEVEAAGGTVEGKVVFTGRPPRSALIQMGADPNCLSINEGKKVIQQELVVHSDRSMGNVFVHIVDDVPYRGDAPADPAVIQQEGCTYHPRILGAMVGQKLKVINNDNTLHNVHSLSEENFFNAGQPFAGMEFDFTLTQAEVMMRIKCDVHPWMVGYLGVKSHPYFAVSGEGGTFRIEGVPPGSYTLQAWQEKLGAIDQQVQVVEGETTTVEFSFAPADSASRTPSLPIEELTVATRTATAGAAGGRR